MKKKKTNRPKHRRRKVVPIPDWAMPIAANFVCLLVEKYFGHLQLPPKHGCDCHDRCFKREKPLTKCPGRTDADGCVRCRCFGLNLCQCHSINLSAIPCPKSCKRYGKGFNGCHFCDCLKIPCSGCELEKQKKKEKVRK